MLLHKSKPAFTMMELLLIVVLISVVTAMARQFLNINRQQIFIYSENCVTYIANEIDKFQNDVIYSKSTVSWFNGYPLASSLTYFWGTTNTWWWVRAVMQSRIYNTLNSWLDIKSYQFSHQSYWAYWERPVLCNNPKFMVAFTQNTLWNWDLGVYKKDGKLFINTGNQVETATIFTWETIINICWVWQMSANSGSLSSAGDCIEAGKIYADKRANSLKVFKCRKINSNNWSCEARPTIY